MSLSEVSLQQRLTRDQQDKTENQLNLPVDLDNYEGPTLFYCEICKVESVSVCYYESTLHTFLCAFLMFLVFNVIGCFIPFCVDTCKDRKQVCPICKQLTGLKKYDTCAC